MTHQIRVVALLAALAAGAAACHSTTTTPTPPPGTPSGPCGTATTAPSIQHVIWIWMENRDYTDIVGAPAAAYINRLAGLCGLVSNYNGVEHPSLPNYIASVSGSTQGIVDDESPAVHPLLVVSLFDQVKSAGLQWRDYQENAPGSCPSNSSGLYAVKHDPAPYFRNMAADCQAWDVPMGTTSSGNFINDVNAGTLPAFSYVTPDLCDGMHDCSTEIGDAFLANWIPIILAGPNYKAGHTAIFIVWDEGNAGNHVPAIVVSPYTRVGTVSSARFDHYSLLRTTEDMLGITTHLAAAGAATSMLSALFGG